MRALTLTLCLLTRFRQASQLQVKRHDSPLILRLKETVGEGEEAQ